MIIVFLCACHLYRFLGPLLTSFAHFWLDRLFGIDCLNSFYSLILVPYPICNLQWFSLILSCLFPLCAIAGVSELGIGCFPLCPILLRQGLPLDWKLALCLLGSWVEMSWTPPVSALYLLGLQPCLLMKTWLLGTETQVQFIFIACGFSVISRKQYLSPRSPRVYVSFSALWF